MTDYQPHLFWTQDLGPYETDLHHFLDAFQRTDTLSEQLKVLSSFIHFPSQYPNAREYALRFRAYLLVLSDLLQQQWKPEIHQGQLYLVPPDWTAPVRGDQEVQQRKHIFRQALKKERDAQFRKVSVQEFIQSVERIRIFNGNPVSIRSLLCDGPSLMRRLQAVHEASNEAEQRTRVVDVIQPYLQLITPEARCEYTGLLLQDIWRYCRYFWVTPYNSTPGRQMFYLIRDAAHPFHAIIGIAALGNSMVQLTVRDDVIGWTPGAIEKRLFDSDFTDCDAQTLLQSLRLTLESAIDDLATADLLHPEELANPTSELLDRLLLVVENSRRERVDLLKQHQGRKQKAPLDAYAGEGCECDATESDSDDSSPDMRAQDSLYRAKRAEVLYDVLFARQALSAAVDSLETVTGLRRFWRTAAGQQAIKTLVRENKKRKVGINMMDIIICGALPPYTTLLGGKLVAMLLASPQVVLDYHLKYAGHASTIASRMKGETVRRDARLAFLGTTSLYSSGSSQYNRIRIPVPGTQDEYLRYLCYGLTLGYGSVHFSQETIESLTDLQEYVGEARLINNRFGEGVNPKLRRLRSGLSAIGLPVAERFLRHRSQRIVYGVPLGRQTYAFLRGETDDPDYFFPVDSPDGVAAMTRTISEFWSTRWLLSRIQHDTYLQAVAQFQPDDVLLSREFQRSTEEALTQQILGFEEERL